MDKVKFQTNIPEIVALQFAQGRAIESPFSGEQIMFTLVDGRKMFLPPFVAEKIADAGIPAHKPFVIVKREVTHGNRRSVEYCIETPNDSTTGANLAKEPAPVAVTPTSTFVKQTPPQNTNALAIAAKLAESLATKPTWSELQAATPASAPAWVEEEQTDPATAAMIEAHYRAIDVVAAAEAYASAKGLAIRYAAEDVRTIAATMFIQASKGGR